MKQDVDYTLIDTDGYDFFGVLNVRCPCCKSGPGHPCTLACTEKHDRTIMRTDVLNWMKGYFPFGVDYRTIKQRALNGGRLSSMRLLHDWDNILIRNKLKGTQ